MVSSDYHLEIDEFINELKMLSPEDVALRSTLDEGRIESHELGIVVE